MPDRGQAREESFKNSDYWMPSSRLSFTFYEIDLKKNSNPKKKEIAKTQVPKL